MQVLLKERVTFFLFLLPLFLYPDKSNGQSNNIDFQTWADFTFTYVIKNKTNIGADMGVRGLVSKHDWNQFYFRPAFHYYFNKTLNAGGGVAIFSTFGNVIKNVTEFRIHQEVGVAWPTFAYIHFYHRLRFEQRFFSYQQDSSFGIELPNDFGARGRYQLSAESSDIHLGNKNKPIYFLAAWELFYSINKAVVERFVNDERILGGFGHRLSPSFKYEIQYIFQKSRKFSIDDLKTSEHLLRLRLFLLIRKSSGTDN